MQFLRFLPNKIRFTLEINGTGSAIGSGSISQFEVFPLTFSHLNRSTHIRHCYLKSSGDLIHKRKLVHEGKGCKEHWAHSFPPQSALHMTDSSVWIGIDGGGTKTKAFIINSEGTLLGMLETRKVRLFGGMSNSKLSRGSIPILTFIIAESINGSSNQNSVGFKGATDTLKALCEELVSSTKRSPADGAFDRFSMAYQSVFYNPTRYL